MSLNSSVTRSSYTGTNLLNTYSYGFKVFSESDLYVVVRNISTGVETDLAITTDYTVTGVGSSSGGTIVLVNASQAWLTTEFLSSSYKLVIVRRRVLTQTADIKNQGDFYPETHEAVFDKFAMVDQQQQDEINRSVKFSTTSDITGFDPEIPATLIGQANKVFGTNAAGDGFEVGPSFTDISGATSAAAAALAAQVAAEAAQVAAESAAGFTATPDRALQSNAATGVVEASAVTTTELGYLSGVTSAVQTQMNLKAPLASPTFTGTVTVPATITGPSARVFTLPTATSTLATLANTEELTNKDIDGGTASDTSRITIPKAAKTTLDGLTRKQGTIVFDTTSNKPYYDDGTTLQIVGSGSGGAKNYVTGGDAESGTTGFATYADAAATSPVDGTGGSPSVTWTTSSTSPLAGTNSFLLTKGATNRQGDGMSYDFTIDAQDKAKVLQISFNYLVSSGTFVAGTSSTASDVTVWIYDVTNAVLIQPSSINLLSNSTTLADKYNATFQTASNSTSYRLILHVGSTSASAYTLKVDTISVSPSTYVYGSPITDWAAYTPTIVGFGTAASVSFKWRRVGDSVQIEGVFTAGTSTAVLGSFTLPNGGVIDTTKIDVTTGNFFGEAILSGNAGATSRKRAKLLAYNNSGNLVYFSNDDYTQAQAPGAGLNGSSLAGAGSVISISLNNLPITGWSSSVQMSDQTDTRVIAARYTSASSAAVPTSATQFVWTTLGLDKTGNSMNTSTGDYTIQVPGVYKITSKIGVNAATINAYVTTIRKNGSSISAWTLPQMVAGSFDSITLATTLAELKSGDVVSVYFNQATTGATYSANHEFLIERISGPSAIAATESVNAKYSNTAGTSVGTGNQTLTFPTKLWDSHGLFSSNTTFTANIPGKYSVNLKFSANSITGLSTCMLRVLVNGVTVSEKGYALNYSTASPFTWDLNDDINLIANDAVTFQFQNGFPSAITSTVTIGHNSVAIKRVGN